MSQLYALTVWQPWATLIAIGAKPFEFRGWDYRTRRKDLVGARIVIHAGARPMKFQEIVDIRIRMKDGESGLVPELAGPVIGRLISLGITTNIRGILNHSAGLCTVTLGVPRLATEIFSGTIDSDRLDHSKWGWPMEDVKMFDAPIPRKGAQGFWRWS